MINKKPMGRNDGHKFDYSKITDKIYLGSDFCTGRSCTFHGDEFKKLGVCVEINLAAEKKEIPPDDIDIYAWLPVVDGYAPSLDQMMMGTALINEAIENGNTIYIHCRNGHARSPSMLAAYFIRFSNKDVSSAIEMIKIKRPEIHIEEVQINTLEKFARLWK